MSTSELRHAGSGEAIRLFTEQDEEGQVSSVIPLRWCISRDTALMLQQQKIDDPQLLIAIGNDGEEVDRMLVPLVDEMCFLQFRRPGRNTVHATIVWPTGNDVSLKKQLSARTDFGEYRMNVLGQFQPRVAELERRRRVIYETMDGGVDDERRAVLQAEVDRLNAELHELRASEPLELSFRPWFDAMRRLDYEARLDVVVPEEMFATPPRWMEWLGNKYSWTRPARDQCDLRRRALATAATLPIVLFFQLVGLVIVETYNLVIAGTLLLFGYRELDFDPLRHPFQYSAKYIGRSKKPSVWWTKKSTDEFNYTTYPPRAAVFLVLNPPVIVGLLVLGAVMYVALGTLFYLVLGAATLAVLTALVFVGTLVTEPLRHRSKEAREQREKEEAERRARQREQLTRELALLACDGSGSRSASVSSLPKSRRTVHLRYYDLKAKVCKPFAR